MLHHAEHKGEDNYLETAVCDKHLVHITACGQQI